MEVRRDWMAGAVMGQPGGPGVPGRRDVPAVAASNVKEVLRTGT